MEKEEKQETERKGRDRQKIEMLSSSMLCCLVEEAVMADENMDMVRLINWFGNWEDIIRQSVLFSSNMMDMMQFI